MLALVGSMGVNQILIILLTIMRLIVATSLITRVLAHFPRDPDGRLSRRLGTRTSLSFSFRAGSL